MSTGETGINGEATGEAAGVFSALKYVSMVQPTTISHGEYEHTFDKALIGVGIFNWVLLYGDNYKTYKVHVSVYSTNSGNYAIVSTLNNRAPPGWAAFSIKMDDVPSLNFFIQKYIIGGFPFKEGYFRDIETPEPKIRVMAPPPPPSVPPMVSVAPSVAPSVPTVSVAPSGGRRRNRRATKKARRNRRRYSRNK